MGRMATTMVGDAHAYTRSRAPWTLEAYRGAKGGTQRGAKFGWRLFHYLSAGGMRAFGRTARQEEAEWRRTRFLAASAVAAAVWLYFWI